MGCKWILIEIKFLVMYLVLNLLNFLKNLVVMENKKINFDFSIWDKFIYFFVFDRRFSL